MQYNDGSHQPAILVSEVHRDVLPGMYSFARKHGRQDGTKALQEFCDEVDTLPFADRIIGYFLAAGGTSEWYPVNPLEIWDKGLYADFSPAFRKEYTRILKEKYGTEEALRKAWNDPAASFDKPYIPTLEERKYIRIDDKILDLCFIMKVPIGPSAKIEMNPNYEGNLGVFLNANRYPAVAISIKHGIEGTANTIIHFAKVIKERYPGKLVGAFAGSMDARISTVHLLQVQHTLFLIPDTWIFLQLRCL